MSVPVRPSPFDAPTPRSERVEIVVERRRETVGERGYWLLRRRLILSELAAIEDMLDMPRTVVERGKRRT